MMSGIVLLLLLLLFVLRHFLSCRRFDLGFGLSALFSRRLLSRDDLLVVDAGGSLAFTR